MASEERKDDEALRLVIKDLEDASHWHERFCKDVDRWYRSWRGVVEKNDKALPWTSKLHPPYGMQIAETIVANLIDDKLRFTAKARPRMHSDLGYLETLRRAARAHELLLVEQIDRERFDEKLDDFYTQNTIAGLTAMKQFWRRDEHMVKRRYFREEPVFSPVNGIQIGVERVSEVVREPFVRYEGPVSEVVDVRDLWWCPGGAVTLDRATSVTHRVWKTYEELESLHKQGVYGDPSALKESRDYSDVTVDRERDLFQQSRAKGMIELIERWSADRVTTVANRKVVLADVKEDPFWHGELPFVVCSTRPDLFRIPGISEIEIIEDLQKALWMMMNQRLDNTALMNMAIVMFRSDFDDPDEFEFAPLARNVVDDPSQVQMWSPNPISAQISIPAEANVRGDMQNLSGAAPFMSGAETQTIDQKTATGISIITNLAQRLLSRKKQRGLMALSRVCWQRAWLNRQFVEAPQLVRTVGPDGAEAWEQVLPEDLQHDCYFEFEPAAESFSKQERIAQSQALLQMALSAMGPVAMMAQAKMAQGMPARTVNIEAYIDDHLRAYEKDDVERYWSVAQAPQMMQAPGGPGGQQGPSGAPGEETVGVTSPLAYGPGSPSNEMSLSPEVFDQRMLAGSGRER